MYQIQNLTNKNIVFQGNKISAYSSITVPSIYDYVTLSKLTNCGKARYSVVKTQISTKAEPSIETKVSAKEVKEPVVEKVVEPVETPVEEVVAEEVVAKEISVEEPASETTELKGFSKKGKKRKG